jgi:membrane-associated protein
MSGVLDQLLTLLLVHGYPILFAVVLVASLGVPLPVSVVALAAGGLAAEGELALGPVFGITLAGAVAGDCASFGVARWAGDAAVARHGARIGIGPARLAAARRRLAGWTGTGVFLTRWLLTPLALPTTVVAALTGFPVAGFASVSLAGELVWTSIYVGLGYAFGQSWPALVGTLGDGAGVAAGLGLAAVGLIAAAVLRWGTGPPEATDGLASAVARAASSPDTSVARRAAETK